MSPSILEGRNAYNDGNHSGKALFPSKIPGHDENEDRNRDGGDRQTKFNVFHIHHDDHELDGESKEEKEVEFEECDVNL